jgi:hypothetical protein
MSRRDGAIVAWHEYLLSVGFTARRATSAEVSKASRLALFLQANRPDPMSNLAIGPNP